MSSKINLELKHYCPDFGKIRVTLKSLGARKVEVKNQKDYFFNVLSVSNGRLKMRAEKKVTTLIWYKRPDFAKGKETPSHVKLYRAHDKYLLDFLRSVFGIKAVVEKKREVWRKKNTLFHLDSVKGVGNVFEVELQKSVRVTEKDRETFASYQKQLLPFLGKIIKGSNVDLVVGKK